MTSIRQPKKTVKGTPPNAASKPKKPGSGRGKPAAGFDQETKTWR